MAKDTVGVVRQYDFTQGPNYTAHLYLINDKELDESENVYWDGWVRPIPGAERVVLTTMAGTTHNITGLYRYVRKDGTSDLVAASDAGRVSYLDVGAWTALASGLNTHAKTFWQFQTFNNTMIALSGKNPVKKWGGPPGAMADLGGTPPQSRYASHHAVDYLFFAGHTSNPSQIRYCDTAAHETWPVGNALEVGRDDGQVITGLKRFGDSTVVFKTASIWLVSGASPDDFQVNPTPADVGCIAARSLVATDAGVFFWSEAGPAMFNGFKVSLLGARLRALLDDVDWSNADKISAGYYPRYRQVFVAYPRMGQTYCDRMLMLDLAMLTKTQTPLPVFWPVTVSGASAMATGDTAAADEQRLWFGHSSGHVTEYNATVTSTLFEGSQADTKTWGDHAVPRPRTITPITTFNGATITTRVRTGGLHLGKPDHVQAVRDITLRTRAKPGRLAVRYAVDGNPTFTTHGTSPYDTSTTAQSIRQKMLEGDSAGQYIVGNILQIEAESVGATGFELYGYEVASETLSRREPA